MKDMEMKISLICSACGNDQFSAIDENIIDIDWFYRRNNKRLKYNIKI